MFILRRLWVYTHLLILAGAAVPVHATDLRAYTEVFPPFNYQQQNGEATGIAYELLTMIAVRAKLQIDTQFLPWPRAVVMNAEDPNSILFTTVRTPQREPNFLWVGPIDPCDISLIRMTKRNDIKINNLSDAYRYHIGLPAHGADLEMLNRLGFPASKQIKVPPSANLMKMLQMGRFDLVSGIVLSYAYEAKKNGLQATDIAPAYLLQPGLGCYFAFNKQVDPALYQRFSSAYQTLVQDGSLAKLQYKYSH